MTETNQPRGKAAVVDAVLDATITLMAEHGPDGVSLRMVAERARVNYGLIHRHFGTREHLLQLAIEREMITISNELAERGLTPTTALQILAAHPLLTDLVFRASLARTDMVTYRPQNVVAERLLRPEGTDPAAEPSHDQKVRVAAFVAFIFGWVALEEMNLRSLDLTGERATVREEVARLLPDIGHVDFANPATPDDRT